MVAAFHVFNHLPLELRQHIWKLSLTPRRIPLGSFSYRYQLPLPPPVPPPAILHACAESRSYLERYYMKIFVREFRFIWVNYDLDTICVHEWTVQHLLHTKLAPVKHLSVYSADQEYFWREVFWDLNYYIPSLEDLEIRPDEKGIRWWYGWDDLLDVVYSSDIPVHFRTVVLSPDPDHEVPALTLENYIKVWRKARKEDMAEFPERFRGQELSDSDDDCRSD